MMVAVAREEAEAIARLAHERGDRETESRAKKILAALNDKQLLTTGQAAEQLGLRSKNTVKAWAKSGRIASEMVGSRYMIPLFEIIRMQETPIARDARALESLHAEIADLGSDEGVSDEEMESLHRSRPGTLPYNYTVQ